jgi:hypothetical protein
MVGYKERVETDARLVILRALAAENDGRLNETLIAANLDLSGHRRSREWTRTQLRFLTDLGALELTEAGTVLIAEITRAGVDHVERRRVIEGVARPSLGV